MFVRVMGIMWMLLGLVGLLRPGMIRMRIGRKLTWRSRKSLLAAMFVFVLFMAGVAFRVSTVPAKVAVIAAAVVVVKFTLLTGSRASGTFLEWWELRPVLFFRVLAGIAFFFGFWLFFF